LNIKFAFSGHSIEKKQLERLTGQLEGQTGQLEPLLAQLLSNNCQHYFKPNRTVLPSKK
jgi:hypothetical protein